MAIGELLHSMSTLVLTCTRHVSRASRKLGLVLTGRRPPAVPSFLLSRRRRRRRKEKKLMASSSSSFSSAAVVDHERNVFIGEEEEEEEEEEEDGGGVLWRHTILLGERCQPLDFSGSIHYDSRGRRLTELTPRRAGSPLSSSFACRSPALPAPVAAAAEKAAADSC